MNGSFFMPRRPAGPRAGAAEINLPIVLAGDKLSAILSARGNSNSGFGYPARIEIKLILITA